MTKVTIINMSEKERLDILAAASLLTDSLNLKIIEFLRMSKKPASVEEIGEDLDIRNDERFANDDLMIVRYHVNILAKRGLLRGYYGLDKENAGVMKKYGPMISKIEKTLKDFQRIVDSSITSLNRQVI